MSTILTENEADLSVINTQRTKETERTFTTQNANDKNTHFRSHIWSTDNKVMHEISEM